MAQISLEPLDSAMLEQVNFGPDAKRWLTNVIDIVNASFATIQNAFNNLLAVGQKDIGSGGVGPISVTVTGLESNNIVNVTLVSSTNSVSISSITVSAGSFDVTFSADPGASAIINYQAYVSQP